MMADAIKLNNAEFPRLCELHVNAPDYDRNSVSIGIAHIGAGHFHRAHQAAYLNLLQGLAHDSGICGVGVVDQLADSLVPITRSQHDNPAAFIEATGLFCDLAHQPRFVEAYRWALDSLHGQGARATLAALVT